MNRIAKVALFAFALSLAAGFCVPAHLTDVEGANLFGLPWALIGAVGYILIMVTSEKPKVVMALTVIAGLTTVWLVMKAFELRLGCPICPVLWVLNLVLLVLAFKQLRRSRRRQEGPTRAPGFYGE